MFERYDLHNQQCMSQSILGKQKSRAAGLVGETTIQKYRIDSKAAKIYWRLYYW